MGTKRLMITTIFILTILSGIINQSAWPQTELVPEGVETINLSGGELGSKPLTIAINPSSNLIYVANEGSNDISVIDGTTNQVVNTINVEIRPQIIGINPVINQIYVTNSKSEEIEIIDGATNLTTGVIKLNSKPFNIAVNPASNLIYVTNKDEGTVSVIDADINQITDIIEIGGNTTKISINPATNLIYVGNETSNLLTVIDGGKNQIIGDIVTSFNPAGIAVNELSNIIYVAEAFEDGIIFEIDGITNKVINSFKPFDSDDSDVSSSLITEIAVNPETDIVYVISKLESGQILNVINGSDNKNISKTELNNDFHRLAVNPSTDLVYITNQELNTVSIIKGSNNLLLFDVGKEFNPFKIGVDSRTNKIYVTNENDTGGIRVIDGSGNVIVGTVDIPAGLSDIAIDSTNNLIYVANEGLISIIDGSSLNVIGSVTIKTPLNNNGGGNEEDNTVGSIDVNPVTHLVYAGTFNQTDSIGKVKVIDGITNQQVSEIDVQGIPSLIKVNSVTNRIYVVNNSEVKVIDGSNNAFLPNIDVGLTPNTLGINQTDNLVYVGTNQRLFIIDGATNRVVANVETDNPAKIINVNAKDDRIYIAMADTGIVDIRDGANLRLLASVRTQIDGNVTGLGFNPNTKLIYLTYEDSDLVAIAPDDESLTPLPERAAMLITFDPVFVSKDTLRNLWEFRVSVTEINGIDVTITDFTIETISVVEGLVEGINLKQEKGLLTFVRWFDDCGKQRRGLIPGFDTACADIKINGAADEDITLVWTFSGTDKNRNDVKAFGSVFLLID